MRNPSRRGAHRSLGRQLLFLTKFLEPRIAPQRIEPKERGRQGQACRQRPTVRDREQSFESSDSPIGLVRLGRDPGENLDRLRTIQRVRRDREKGNGALRKS